MSGEFTTIVGLDDEHFQELKISYQSWSKYRPDLMAQPMTFVCDSGQGSASYWEAKVKQFGHPSHSVQMFDGTHLRGVGASQREVMLTALVWAAAQVETQFFLKLDTAAVAVSRGAAVQRDWWNSGRAFVSHRWGFTRPSRFIAQLNSWADGVPTLAKHEAPLIELPNDLEDKVYHRRIQSFIMFGTVDFARAVWSMICLDSLQRLPCASQDTLLWYVAERMGWPYVTLNFKRLGWKHGRGALRGWNGAS